MNLKQWLGSLGLSLLALGAQANEDRWASHTAQTLPSTLESLRLATPLQRADNGRVLANDAVSGEGPYQVIVQLSSPPGARIDDDVYGTRANHQSQLLSEQADFINRSVSANPGIRVLGQVQHVLNAVFLEVPESALQGLADDPAVSRIAPVGHYRMDLSETVPYIGASTLQKRGLKGKGVSVAVLDSGIDYTHADLGGSGDPADYLSNDGTIIEPNSFPTKKVVGGFDFLGNQWPNGPVLPDPDPLDDLAQIPGSFAGHGTHVAAIIGGKDGVAPKVDLHAVKVCASLSSACNGIALIQGMEYAVDPNGDGDTEDHVDIINMSLGGDYGQAFDDDLAAAVDNASAIGSFTVAAAGNCGDRPYCTGTPAAAPTALSVAQTHVPSATQFFMNVVAPEAAAGQYNAVRYSWSTEPGSLIEGLVQYGDLDGTNLDGCAAFTGDLSDMIVAVDRGGCFFSDKVRNIENAGGILGIVMLIAPGAPFNGAFGGGDPITIPGFNIGVDEGNIIRAGGAVVQFGPEFTASLVGTTVSSTGRGPGMSFNALKPEIGAPGASVSAEVGTGTERTPFGGTSGASPMVAGSAALLKQACMKGKRPRYRFWEDDDDNDDKDDHYKRWGKWGKWGFGKRRDCSPLELKAMLMNHGDTDIISDTTGALAETTRIGAGEVRVDDSGRADFWVYSPDDDQPSLGLGFVSASEVTRIKRKVKIVNTSKRWQWIQVLPEFRYDDDAEVRANWRRTVATSGAVKIRVSPSGVWLPPGASQNVRVNFVIDPSLLDGNPMSSGVEGANPATLSDAEIDGYLRFYSFGRGSASMPWHMLPRRAADLVAERNELADGGDLVGLINQGAGTAQNDTSSIIGLSDELQRGAKGAQSPTPDLRAVGVNTFVVGPGFCSAGNSFVWAFTINTWQRQSHLLPVSHQVAFDIGQDGIFDFVMLNRDLSGLGTLSDGRQLAWVVDLATGNANAFFFAQHATNSANTTLLMCAEQIGLGFGDLLATPVDVSVISQDFYYGGPGDFIGGITVTPLGERYLGQTTDIPGGEAGSINVLDFGNFPLNSPDLGVMITTDGDRGAGNRGGATAENEAVLLLGPGVTPPAPLP